MDATNRIVRRVITLPLILATVNVAALASGGTAGGGVGRSPSEPFASVTSPGTSIGQVGGQIAADSTPVRSDSAHAFRFPVDATRGFGPAHRPHPRHLSQARGGASQTFTAIPTSRWKEGFDVLGCDGTVNAILPLDDGTVLLGGAFRTCGNVVVNSIAIWEPRRSRFTPLASGVGGGTSTVTSLAVSGNSVFAGGTFAVAGGIAVGHIARFDTELGAWRPLGTGQQNGVNGSVNALAIIGSDLYVGGTFTVAGGASSPYLARFDIDEEGWMPFGHPGAGSVNGFVYSLFAHGESLLVGGEFERSGEIVSNNIASYNTALQTWSAFGTGPGTGVSQAVRAIAVAGNRVYVGGTMLGSGTQVVNHIARFNSVSQVWEPVGKGDEIGANDWVHGLAASGNNLFAVGRFDRIGGVSTRGAARFDLTTETWHPLSEEHAQGTNGPAYSVSVASDGLYIGGGFAEAGNVFARGIARFDSVLGRWSPLDTWQPHGVGGSVSAIVAVGHHLYVGGSFRWAGGTRASSIARYDMLKRQWTALGGGSSEGVSNDGFDGWVNSLLLVGSQLYVAGYFSRAGGIPARNLARFDLASETWSSVGNGSENGVNHLAFALAHHDGALYVGGTFSMAGTVPASGVARFELASGAWHPLGAGAANGVGGPTFALLVHRGSLFVGGNFVTAGGVVRPKLARFDTATQEWLNFDSMMDVDPFVVVTALSASGGKIYLGGRFARAGGTSAFNVASFDVDLQRWASLGQGSNNGVRYSVSGTTVGAIAERAGKVYVTGAFDRAGDSDANFIARFDPVGGIWEPLDDAGANGLDAEGRAMIIVGSEVVVGGAFSMAGRVPSVGIARYDDRRPPFINLQAPTAPVTANLPVGLQATISAAGFPVAQGVASFSADGILIDGCTHLPIIGDGGERTATCVTTRMRVGTRLVRAEYSGDALNYPVTGEVIEVFVVEPELVLAPDELPRADVGIDYAVGLDVAGSGAIPPFLFRLESGVLPPGLVLQPDGRIVGIPSVQGLFPFRVAATDSSTTSATGGAFTTLRDYTLEVGAEVTFRNGFE